MKSIEEAKKRIANLESKKEKERVAITVSNEIAKKTCLISLPIIKGIGVLVILFMLHENVTQIVSKITFTMLICTLGVIVTYAMGSFASWMILFEEVDRSYK